MHDLIYDLTTETGAFENDGSMAADQPSTATAFKEDCAYCLEQIATLKEVVRMKDAAISWFTAEVAELAREFEDLKIAAASAGYRVGLGDSCAQASASEQDDHDGSASKATADFTSQLFSLHYRLKSQTGKDAMPCNLAADKELDEVDGF